jgi:hypothetical protein
LRSSSLIAASAFFSSAGCRLRSANSASRAGAFLVVGGQRADRSSAGLAAPLLGGQHHVAQGDRAVVHAAAEIDRVALLDVVDVVDVVQGVVDVADAADRQAGQHHHQRQHGAEAQRQAGLPMVILRKHGSSL